MTKAAARAALAKGRKYIVETQQPDGSFRLTRGHDGAASTDGGCTVLAHSLLLDTLREQSGDAELNQARERLADWLVRALGGAHGSDLDMHNPRATFYALAALAAYRQSRVSQAMLAAAVRYLVQHEVRSGGPYRTTTESGASEAPDLATNIAIARFLRVVAQPLPQLDAYIVSAAQHSLASPVFTTAWPLEDFVQALFPAPSIRAKAPAGIAQIIKTQRQDGSWPIEMLFTSEAQQACGMVALSTARALAVLQQHLERLAPAATAPKPARRPNSFTQPYNAIITAAKRETSTLDPLVQATVHGVLDQVQNADTNHEIGPLALRFAAALPSHSRAVPTSILYDLGVANLYAWAAYTIYDDFLDDEGEPALLSAANVSLRRSMAAFQRALPEHSAFQQLVTQTFDTIDGANAWELAHCRFAVHGHTIRVGTLPDYGDLERLYERSLSHSLPVIGVLAAAGAAPDSPLAQTTHDAFKQYLVVRQLSDDLRDWREDLAAGHISYVVGRMLADMRVRPGNHRLPVLLSRVEKHFWRNALPAFCQDIKLRSGRAYELLASGGLSPEHNVARELLVGIDRSIDRTIAQYQHADLFLKTYRDHA